MSEYSDLFKDDKILAGSTVQVTLLRRDAFNSTMTMRTNNIKLKEGQTVTFDDNMNGKIKAALCDTSDQDILGVVTKVVQEPYVDPLRRLAWKKLKEIEAASE